MNSVFESGGKIQRMHKMSELPPGCCDVIPSKLYIQNHNELFFFILGEKNWPGKAGRAQPDSLLCWMFKNRLS